MPQLNITNMWAKVGGLSAAAPSPDPTVPESSSAKPTKTEETKVRDTVEKGKDKDKDKVKDDDVLNGNATASAAFAPAAATGRENVAPAQGHLPAPKKAVSTTNHRRPPGAATSNKRDQTRGQGLREQPKPIVREEAKE